MEKLHSPQTTLLLPISSELPHALSLQIEQRVRAYYERKGWQIDEYLAPVIVHLSRYFAGDDRFETCQAGTDGGWCLGKGICLIGTPGSSKSVLMEAMNHTLNALGSEFRYRTFQTMQVVSDFKKEKGGGFDSFKPLRDKFDIYYDEIGKVEISEVSHYRDSGNIDRLIIEARYDLSVAGYNFHCTTNMSPAVLRAYLTEKYYSRLCRMCNLIDYSNANDYRLIDRPRRRGVVSGPSRTEIDEKNQKATDELMTRFVAEVQLWLSQGEPLYLSAETMIFDCLVEGGHIQNSRCTPTHPLYEASLGMMRKDLAQERACLDLNDKGKARELNELIRQASEGMAMTTPVLDRLTMAFKKTVVREFVRVNMDTREKIDRLFPKVG